MIKRKTALYIEITTDFKRLGLDITGGESLDAFISKATDWYDENHPKPN